MSRLRLRASVILIQYANRHTLKALLCDFSKSQQSQIRLDTQILEHHSIAGCSGVIHSSLACGTLLVCLVHTVYLLVPRHW